MSKHDRQSFLGEASEQVIKATTVGLVGLGGGGSHVVQQLAHIGVERYVLVDPDVSGDERSSPCTDGRRTNPSSTAPRTSGS